MSYDANLVVASGGNVSPGTADSLWLALGGDLTIQSGGWLSGSGRGYAGGTGPGSPGFSGGNYEPGGAYAGEGGGGYVNPALSQSVYGSPLQPTALGSGGGVFTQGAAGGGAIRLSIGGVLHVDGVLSVSGSDGPAHADGGGSGGSLWAQANAFEGSGTVSATGGNAFEAAGGGGGGGGRIALEYTTSTFAGTLSSNGGTGFQRGGGGTVYVRMGPGRGTITVANTGADLTAARTRFTGYPVSYDANLVVAPGGAVAPGTLDSLWLSVTGDFTVQAGGWVSSGGRGYAGGAGPGSPGFTGSFAGGAAHGGRGGNGLGQAGSTAVYGSVTQPTALGSGGGVFTTGAPGGGAIRLSVGGVLHVDGSVNSNGGDGVAFADGGGSGGSVWAQATRLEGAGTISAKGGDGNGSSACGGGGGGRIAIDAACWPDPSRPQLTVAGGTGYQAGAPGSIYPSLAVRTYVLNPTFTYLRTNADTGGDSCLAVRLADLGVHAGDSLKIARHGAFRLRCANADSLASAVFCVFSSSNVLLAKSARERVPGARTARTEVVTPATLVDSLLTDIPQDFALTDSVAYVIVPPLATWLFAAAGDNYYGDNCDPSGAFALDLVKLGGGCGQTAGVSPAGPLAGATPKQLEFAPPAPNPARGVATLAFGLPRAGRVSLDVYDVGGRRIANLMDGVFAAGRYARTWDGAGRGGASRQPGVYFVRLVTQDGARAQRLTLIR